MSLLRILWNIKKEMGQSITLNRWEKHLSNWCPAQIYYYFVDNDGGHWLIYLRWDSHRGDEPWSAELLRCDDNWELIPECPENVHLLEDEDHTPGTVKGYYYDVEYPFLMKRVLEMMKVRFPNLDFPNNQ